MKNVQLYVLVAALTAGNIGFRLHTNDKEPVGKPVSHLEAGDRVESVELDRLLAVADVQPSACQMIVAFSPDCPFCEAAAEREALVRRSGPYAEPLWLTDQERPRLSAFTSALSGSTRHAVSPEAFKALDVDAVPALYLLDGEGTLRWVGAYRGDESTEVLAQRCGEAPSTGPVPTREPAQVTVLTAQ